MKYSRPPPRATSTTRYCYGMIAILSALVLVLLWLSTQIASPRIAADLSRSDFTVNADQQELAQRILALNGLVDTAAVDRNSRGGLVLQLPYLKTDRFGVTDVELTPPTLHTTDFDDSEPDGTECPPVESARADMPVSMRESGVKHMPPIPTLYEPRAPKALWMPPIPISKDRHDQRLFYVDPKTGLSTTKIVYSLLGRSGAPTVNGANRENWSNQQVTAPEFAPRSLLHTDFLPAAQPTCPQVALRTVAYWHAWSDQQLAAKPLNVLVWHGTWLRTTSEAQKGGPMGELGLFTSTMLALTAMSARVTLLAHPQGEQAMKEALEHFDEYDIILIDTYSADVMTQTGHITNPDVLCRIRALDYWVGRGRETRAIGFGRQSAESCCTGPYHPPFSLCFLFSRVLPLVRILGVSLTFVSISFPSRAPSMRVHRIHSSTCIVIRISSMVRWRSFIRHNACAREIKRNGSGRHRSQHTRYHSRMRRRVGPLMRQHLSRPPICIQPDPIGTSYPVRAITCSRPT